MTIVLHNQMIARLIETGDDPQTAAIIMSHVRRVVERGDWDEVANEGETPYDQACVLVWQFIQEGHDPGDIMTAGLACEVEPPPATTLWEQVSPYSQKRMVQEYLNSVADHNDERQAWNELAHMDDDLLREHLREGVEWVQEDEHDRAVDDRYGRFTRYYESKHDASFQDMAHALALAQDCIRDRIERLEGLPDNPSTRTSTGHMIARLKMSHHRLAEMLLQRGEWDEGDGYLTRSADIWIRG
jgi:hypothetical protein